MHVRIFPPTAALAALLTTWACGSDSSPIEVRVRNDRNAALTVSIGSADFGSVAPGTVTGYRAVNEQGNVVVVDGQVVDTASFCEGCAAFGGGRWTYFFVEGGMGFGIDPHVQPAGLPLAPDVGR